MLDKKSLFAVNLILCLIISLEDDSRAERGKGNDYRGTEWGQMADVFEKPNSDLWALNAEEPFASQSTSACRLPARVVMLIPLRPMQNQVGLPAATFL